MCRSGVQYHCHLLRHIHLAQWLRKVSLVAICQKPTLMVRCQPIRPVERQLFRDFLTPIYTRAQATDLPAAEVELWQAISAVDRVDHTLTHPDFQYRAIQTVFVGRAP